MEPTTARHLSLEEPPELEFDQSEKITSRLRDLVRSYPKGLGLVKEFLQNADDAGATRLLMVLDRRHHRGNLGTPERNVVLGPSLLFVNDKIFSEVDFRRIQDLGGGGKLEEASGTGRFGQGFNTCFSVTDHPSLLTGNRVAWFDPHKRTHNGARNARAWELREVEKIWPDWIRTFHVGGLADHDESFNGTIFRLPLRTALEAKRSEILKEPFSASDFDKIIQELAQVGPNLLLFLRNVLSLEVREIKQDGRSFVRYRVDTLNRDEVINARRPLSEISGNPMERLEEWGQTGVSLPLARFRHKFRILRLDGQNGDEAWGIVSGLFRGADNLLLDRATEVCEHGEKALPWAGAALRINPPPSSEDKGGLACFLPLPEGLPWSIWIHGWFDIDSSRRGITRSNAVGVTAEARANWNVDLMKYGAGTAWALLVEFLLGEPKGSKHPYTFWPRPTPDLDELQNALVQGFYEYAGELFVLRVVDGSEYSWGRLSGGATEVGSRDWLNNLSAPLRAQGWSMFDPSLPPWVKEGFVITEQAIPFLQPEALADVLRSHGDHHVSSFVDSPFPMLRKREWVVAVARFCAKAGAANLAHLPLAVMADGSLRTFNACGKLFQPEKEQIRLFETYPHRILDEQFRVEVELDKPVAEIDLWPFDFNGLIDWSLEVLENGVPSNAWLENFFTFLATFPRETISSRIDELHEMELVPDQKGKFHPMGLVSTPLIPGDGSAPYRAAFDALGIPIFTGDLKLWAAVRNLEQTHNDLLVWPLTPNDVFFNLAEHGEQGGVLNEEALDDPNLLRILLEFLTSGEMLGKGDTRLPKVRKARFLPTQAGERVSAETVNTFLPGNFSPPVGLGGAFHILNPGPENRWVPLFQILGVQGLDAATFLKEALLPSIQKEGKDRALEHLRWLRDNLRGLEATVPSSKRDQLKALVRSSAILPVNDSKWAEPERTYHPDALEAKKVLGQLALYPDKKVLHRDWDLWLEFFGDLGLLQRPSAKDITAAIQYWSKDAQTHGASSIKKRLTPILTYLRENWEFLATEVVSGKTNLAESLQKTPWLTALSQHHGHFPGQREWDDRLWLASELQSPRNGHLIASQLPILEGQDLPSAMATDLRHPTSVPIDALVRHFCVIKALRSPAPGAGDGVGKSAHEIYRALGRVDPSKVGAFAKSLVEMAEGEAVLLDGKWHAVRNCFFKRLGVELRPLISLAEGKDLPVDSHVLEGLRRLGVRDDPSFDDLHAQMKDLAHREGTLSESAMRKAMAILHRIRKLSLSKEHGNSLILPTRDSRLVLGISAFICDDPRIKGKEVLTEIPLLTEQEDVLSLAKEIGVRNLRQSLHERLAEFPMDTSDTRHQAWLEELHYRISSSPFQLALKRLAVHESLECEEVESPEIVGAKSFDQVEVRITRELVTEAVVDINGADVVAFTNHKAQWFMDDIESTLWLRNNAFRVMKENVVRAICDFTGIKEQLHILALLGAEPEEMGALLDEYGIAVLMQPVPGGYGETLLDPVEEFGEQPDSEENEYSSQSTDMGESELEHDETRRPPHGRESTPMPGANGHGASNDRTPERPGPGTGARPTSDNSRGPGTRPSGDSRSKPSPGDLPPPPTNPGRGSTATQGRPQTASNNQARLRTYVHGDPQDDYDSGGLEAERASDIGEAGELAVVDFEQAHGRQAHRMPRNHEGYDIESDGAEGRRYIEVKSMDGRWGIRGVGVSRPQHQMAIRLGLDWWLYVVEHAKDPDTRRIHLFQNPFHQVSEFRFDSGWLEINPGDGSEDMAPIAHDPVLGKVYVRLDGSLATVTLMERRGELWIVTVEVEGQSSRVPWNPKWKGC